MLAKVLNPHIKIIRIYVQILVAVLLNNLTSLHLEVFVDLCLERLQHPGLPRTIFFKLEHHVVNPRVDADKLKFELFANFYQFLDRMLPREVK